MMIFIYFHGLWHIIDWFERYLYGKIETKISQSFTFLQAAYEQNRFNQYQTLILIIVFRALISDLIFVKGKRKVRVGSKYNKK